MIIKRANIHRAVQRSSLNTCISRRSSSPLVTTVSPHHHLQHYRHFSTTSIAAQNEEQHGSNSSSSNTVKTTTTASPSSPSSSSAAQRRKTYAGLSRDVVEAKLREQGIQFTGGKQKVQMTKFVNPIFNRPIDYELVKPSALGADISRKTEMATRILTRPHLQEQKTSEYRHETDDSKSGDLKQIEQSIRQVQQRVLDKLKKRKAYSTDRDSSVFIALYPARLLPNDAREATEFQTKVIETLLQASEQQSADPEYSHKYRYAFELHGWKVGATQPSVQAKNRLEKPFLGPIFKHQVYRQTSDTDRINLCNSMIGQLMPQAECEFVFRFKRALAARQPNQEPYTREQVAECIGEVIPAMELVGSRIEDIGLGSATVGSSKVVDVSDKEFFLKIADCGSHLALLLGPHSIENPTLDDLDSLHAARVEFNMNEDEEVIHGRGNNVYEGQINASSVIGPLDTTTWAINEITAHVSEGGRGQDVPAGMVISSGTMTGKSRPIDNGDQIVASFTGVPTFDGMTVRVCAEF